MRGARRSDGFTLMEVIAVVLLTTILFVGAITYYTELSTRSNQAAETTRQWRHATALLDRVAMDLERAYMVKKPDALDPIDHPWLFVAESRYADAGADQVKFTARRPVDLATEGPRGDIAVVSYVIRGSDEWEDEYELRRSHVPGLPSGREREFPRADETLLVADGIAEFRLRFLDGAGTWHERWDSTQLEHTGSLPVAAEIEIAFVPPPDREEPLVPTLRREVTLPLPAIDMETLADPEAYGLDSGEEGEDEEAGEDDDTPACECIDEDARDADGMTVLDLVPGDDENVQRIRERLCEIPWASAKQFVTDLDHPGILCD